MVFEKVRELLVDQLDVEEDVVTMEANIQSDLGADSLDIVDLVMSLEEEFDCEIPDEEIENIKTVGDIVKYIEDHANSRVSESPPGRRGFYFFTSLGKDEPG